MYQHSGELPLPVCTGVPIRPTRHDLHRLDKSVNLCSNTPSVYIFMQILMNVLLVAAPCVKIIVSIPLEPIAVLVMHKLITSTALVSQWKVNTIYNISYYSSGQGLKH